MGLKWFIFYTDAKVGVFQGRNYWRKCTSTSQKGAGAIHAWTLRSVWAEAMFASLLCVEPCLMNSRCSGRSGMRTSKTLRRLHCERLTQLRKEREEIYLISAASDSKDVCFSQVLLKRKTDAPLWKGMWANETVNIEGYRSKHTAELVWNTSVQNALFFYGQNFVFLLWRRNFRWAHIGNNSKV